MKTAVNLCSLLFSVCVMAQTTDSTAIRLKYYKDLYDQKLINVSKYQHLKSMELQIPLQVNNATYSLRASVLNQRYHAKITGGAILITVGLGTVLTSAAVGTFTRTSSFPDREFKNDNGATPTTLKYNFEFQQLGLRIAAVFGMYPLRTLLAKKPFLVYIGYRSDIALFIGWAYK